MAKVVCPHCGGNARIASRSKMNDKGTIANLRCQCLDADNCGAIFVTTQAYSHTITPPIKSTQQICMDLISRLSKDEKQELQRDLFV